MVASPLASGVSLLFRVYPNYQNYGRQQNTGPSYKRQSMIAPK